MTLRQRVDVTDTEAADLDNVIEVGGLRQKYGDFEAVRGVSFTVPRGEIFALLGTNGAGKTTTMEVLEGFTPATDGTVRVLGLDPIRNRRELRLRVGIMLQEGGFLGDLSVAETVDLWKGLSEDAGRPVTLSGTTTLPGHLTLMGRVRGVDRRTMGALELVGLENKARTKVRQLSGGQKRRLDLALAVLSAPEVLFLDEPTTGMDPEARRTTWKVIEDLRAGGTTVLLTTHYLEEAERLADRLAIMHEGRIHTYGTVEEVVAGSGDTISFRLPGTTWSFGDLPSLDGTAPTLTYAGGGTEVGYILTGEQAEARAHAALRPLLRWADEQDETLERLAVRRGTLEDAFMRVVGDVR
ncbi:ABC-2 type transport system ATP-binding protein [Streptosporangium lutulentum]|uniref:ABC-2 type transport system ATP-binding protein n=2 Tax=Streptosporangium lutulentum TaxID=1461250 RepID=A0ABT9QHE7_9ACTN|nr:ABC transporter ATP-binding protein [Streptosporangium lutulentum]MDP9846176.1 ABC-2 type transport system ATP-binding protein [Streptosporangium lutulentum]